MLDDVEARDCAIFYIESPFISGAEAQILRNLELPLEANHQMHLFAACTSDFHSNLAEMHVFASNSLKIHSLDLFQGKNENRFLQILVDQIRFLFGLVRGFRAARSLRPRFVHVNNGGFPGAAGSRGFAIGAKVGHSKSRIFMTINNLAVNYKPLPRKLDYLADRILVRCISLWITGSQAAASRLRQVLRLAEGMTKVIPNGIPPLKCSNGDSTCSFDSLGIQSGSLVTTSIGHLEARKGHAVLIRALALLRKESGLDRRWIFLIEGLGAQESELKKLIHELNLDDHVRLIGKTSCVFHLLQASDIFVHPSIANEDLPNVITEAMALGKPIVGSKIAGIPEQIEDGVSGLLVEPGWDEGLAEKLGELLRSQKLREEFGFESFAKYMRQFLPEIALESYKRLYGLDSSVEN